MVQAKTQGEVDGARRGIARIGKLSDNIVGIGPFGIGIDGILAWIPGLGDLYSVAAGGLLLFLGLRARVPVLALVEVAGLVGLRSVIGLGAELFAFLPIYAAAGAAVDLFRGHKMSADLLIKAIDKTHYVAASREAAKADPGLSAGIDAARRDGMRVVYLG
jgi:hypothetical protein